MSVNPLSRPCSRSICSGAGFRRARPVRELPTTQHLVVAYKHRDNRCRQQNKPFVSSPEAEAAVSSNSTGASTSTTVSAAGTTVGVSVTASTGSVAASAVSACSSALDGGSDAGATTSSAGGSLTSASGSASVLMEVLYSGTVGYSVGGARDKWISATADRGYCA